MTSQVLNLDNRKLYALPSPITQAAPRIKTLTLSRNNLSSFYLGLYMCMCKEFIDVIVIVPSLADALLKPPRIDIPTRCISYLIFLLLFFFFFHQSRTSQFDG
jgi:hypothetical protein